MAVVQCSKVKDWDELSTQTGLGVSVFWFLPREWTQFAGAEAGMKVCEQLVGGTKRDMGVKFTSSLVRYFREGT